MGQNDKAEPLAPLVALTGAVGSGKSTVARLFAEFGATIIDADELARTAVCSGSAGLQEVVATFGEEILLPNGELDRRKLGAAVFGDSELRRKLEAILHPRIRLLFDERLALVDALPETAPLVVYVIPLLFETGWKHERLGAVVTVSASREACLERIQARDGLSAIEAGQRFDAQLPLEQKEAQSDFVIRNDGSRADLRQRVKVVYESLTQ